MSIKIKAEITTDFEVKYSADAKAAMDSMGPEAAAEVQEMVAFLAQALRGVDPEDKESMNALMHSLGAFEFDVDGSVIDRIDKPKN